MLEIVLVHCCHHLSGQPYIVHELGTKILAVDTIFAE